MEGGGGDRASGDAYDVPSGSNFIPLQSHRFTHQTPHAIAFDSVANALAGGEPESTMGQIVGQDDQNHQRVLVAAPLASHLLKTIFVPEAILPAHGVDWKLDGQAFPPAQTPPLEDVASPRGLHAGSEAVGLGAFSHFGLPGSFRHFSTSLLIIDVRA